MGERIQAYLLVDLGLVVTTPTQLTMVVGQPVRLFLSSNSLRLTAILAGFRLFVSRAQLT